MKNKKSLFDQVLKDGALIKFFMLVIVIGFTLGYVIKYLFPEKLLGLGIALIFSSGLLFGFIFLKVSEYIYFKFKEIEKPRNHDKSKFIINNKNQVKNEIIKIF